MKDCDANRLGLAMARRVFLKGAGSLGAVALADLLGAGKLFGQSHGVLKKLDFAPTAKRVIRIHMIGAVSQVDTFDYKPMLEKMHGQELPPSIRGTGRLSSMSAAQASFP